MMNAYFVEFLRTAAGDCTIGGVSTKYTHAFLYRGAVPSNHPAEYAALILDDKPIMCAGGLIERIRAVSADKPHRCMFGGNFVFGDSRFCKEVCKYPIPVDDRIESK